MRCDSMFVDLMRIVLNLAITSEKDYQKKFVAIYIMDVVKVMMCSDFLIKTSV